MDRKWRRLVQLDDLRRPVAAAVEEQGARNGACPEGPGDCPDPASDSSVGAKSSRLTGSRPSRRVDHARVRVHLPDPERGTRQGTDQGALAYDG
jgi:hypothetical protein